jgi:hypothetical protein
MGRGRGRGWIMGRGMGMGMGTGMEMGMGTRYQTTFSFISPCVHMFQISYVPCKRHGDVYVA